MSHLRRIFLALLIFLIAGWAYKSWRVHQPGEGLFDLFEKSSSEPHTSETSSASDQGSSFEDAPTLSRLDEEISALAQRVLPSVVSIDSQNVQEKRISLLRRDLEVVPSLGSGVFIDKRGYILTNFHVIANALEIRITTNDGKAYKGSVLGSNPKADIAVIKIQGADREFPVLKFADSDKVKVGQTVFAVGNPFGLSGSFTQGIISARRISQNGVNILQTDTVINPGNSGGPLVNIHGEIVGINFSIYRGDQRLSTWQGVGLSIPSNDARAAADVILRQEPKPVGFLGIVIDEVVFQTREGRIGVTINEVVPNSPAAKAGLQPDDLIIGVNGEPLEYPEEVYVIAQSTPIGRPIQLEILRNSQVISVSAVIAPQK